LILDHHKDIQHADSSKKCRVFEFLIDFLLNHLYSTDITNIGFLIKSLNLNADVSNYVIDYYNMSPKIFQNTQLLNYIDAE